MQRITLFLLSAILAVALAGGQYYVPRAYYTIDAEGHASAPVPLRRLRRAANWYNREPSNNANANSVATASDGGSASSTATANSGGGDYPHPYPAQRAAPARGGWSLGGTYGSAKPQGVSQRLVGAMPEARSLSASASVDVNSQGQGYYDTSVNY